MTTSPRPAARTVPPVPGLRDVSPAALAERLVPILRDVPFPARRWQVVTAGELYGCDGVSRELLARLPDAEFSTPQDLLGVLSSVLSGRSLPVRPVRAPARVPHRPAPHRPAPHRPAPAGRPRAPRSVA
jgi:hypothetical protein